MGNFVRRYPLGAYFTLTFLISWTGVAGCRGAIFGSGRERPQDGGLADVPGYAARTERLQHLPHLVPQCSRRGLPDLFRRMRRASVGYWYLALLIPPALVLTVLYSPKTLVSPAFAPIGWTGYAFPRMRDAMGPLAASIILGLIWSAWHIPVIDYLGTATPHGSFWLPFFLAFAAAMTAIRVIIGWVYLHTSSVLLAQMLHAASTGSLVVFSPPNATAGQEAFWYAVYACTLWVLVGWIRGKLNGGSASGRVPR